MRHKDDLHKRIAEERIVKLFVEAENMFNEYPNLSQRYVELARKIATRYNVRFNKDQKRLFCKNCNAYLKQGKNSTIRLQHGKIVLKCSECGYVRRWVYRN